LALVKTLDLPSVKGRGRVQFEDAFSREGRSEHAAFNWRSKGKPTVLEREGGGITLPNHVLSHGTLVASLKRPELGVHLQQVSAGSRGQISGLEHRSEEKAQTQTNTDTESASCRFHTRPSTVGPTVRAERRAVLPVYVTQHSFVLNVVKSLHGYHGDRSAFSVVLYTKLVATAPLGA
jgi:hypothetical protein